MDASAVTLCLVGIKILCPHWQRGIRRHVCTWCYSGDPEISNIYRLINLKLIGEQYPYTIICLTLRNTFQNVIILPLVIRLWRES